MTTTTPARKRRPITPRLVRAALRVIDTLPMIPTELPQRAIKSIWPTWTQAMLREPEFLAGLAARGIRLKGSGRWTRLVRLGSGTTAAIETLKAKLSTPLTVKEATTRTPCWRRCSGRSSS